MSEAEPAAGGPSAASRPLEGRIAVVTGASRGIGRAAALALSQAGAHIVALARTQGALEDLDDAIRADGGAAATLVPLDLRDFDALDRLGAALHERWASSTSSWATPGYSANSRR